MTEEAPNTDAHPEQASQPAQASQAGRATPAGGVVRSTISRPWLVRIVVITAMLSGYGAWSLYDAYVSYPERGARYAGWAEWNYLRAAQDADESREDPGILRREAAVEDPVRELERLKSSEVRDRLTKELSGTTRPKRAQMELAREAWLTALSRIDRLHPVYTNFYTNPDPVALTRLEELETIPRMDRTPAQREELRGLESQLDKKRPRDRLEMLDAEWTTETQPGMLQSYDIPVNKAAAVGCFAFSIYLIGLFIRVATRTYTWQPGDERLTLPSGESITPDQLADIDKRKWDKFIVFLVLKDSHPELGGAEVKVDTYRHGLVEDWILQMERTAFPDRAEAAEAEAKAAEAENAEDDPDEATAADGSPAGA